MSQGQPDNQGAADEDGSAGRGGNHADEEADGGGHPEQGDEEGLHAQAHDLNHGYCANDRAHGGNEDARGETSDARDRLEEIRTGSGLRQGTLRELALRRQLANVDDDALEAEAIDGNAGAEPVDKEGAAGPVNDGRFEGHDLEPGRQRVAGRSSISGRPT